MHPPRRKCRDYIGEPPNDGHFSAETLTRDSRDGRQEGDEGRGKYSASKCLVQRRKKTLDAVTESVVEVGDS